MLPRSLYDLAASRINWDLCPEYLRENLEREAKEKHRKILNDVLTECITSETTKISRYHTKQSRRSVHYITKSIQERRTFKLDQAMFYTIRTGLHRPTIKYRYYFSLFKCPVHENCRFYKDCWQK